MMSKKLYDKYKEKIRLVGEKENYPTLSNLQKINCKMFNNLQKYREY